MFTTQLKCQEFKRTVHVKPYTDQARMIISKINEIEEIAFISMSYLDTCRINVVCTREGLGKLMSLLKIMSICVNTAIPKLSVNAFLSSQYRTPVFSFYLPIFNRSELCLAVFDKALELLNTPNQDDCFVSQDLLDKSRAMNAQRPAATDVPYAIECHRIRKALSLRKGIDCFIAKVENDGSEVFADQLTLRCVCTAEGFEDLVDFFVKVEDTLGDGAIVTAVFHAAKGVSTSSVHIYPSAALERYQSHRPAHIPNDVTEDIFGEVMVSEEEGRAIAEHLRRKLNECIEKVVAVAEEGYITN